MMRTGSKKYGQMLVRGASTLAVAVALMQASGASAQTTTAQTGETPAEQAGAGETGKLEQATGTREEQEITVTGSRISRAGFDQPTPTTVIGDVELRQGQRSNIAQVLNDLPQVRPSITPTSANGNTITGNAPVDLRGLGTLRTLTLLNGRRFVGDNNLNFVPFNLVDRVEIVTGGASAAYGAGAVAGVVNIILKRDLEGITVGAQSGISSRGDGMRYGADGAFGTGFAGGNGRFLVGVEYVNDKAIPDRNSRRNLGSAGIVRVTPGSATDRRTELVRDVNLSIFGRPQSPDGLILTGPLAGQVFNRDGTLRPASLPDARGVGGTDSRGLFDDIAVSGPLERFNTYARVSYDLGGAEIWADGTYVYTRTNGPFLPDFFISQLTISANNAFLSPAIRNQLAAARQTSFTLGRVFNDIYFLQFDTKRTNYEGAIGINGEFGNGWKYSAHYSHGEIEQDERLENSRLVANFNNAINAVRNSAGQIVCAINADASTTNDDPACAPLNPFGRFNASPAAVAYTTATQGQRFVQKLDSAAAEIERDLFSLWAGPITAVIGAEARREKRTADPADPLDLARAFGSLTLYATPLSGGFNVKEGFGEIAVPVLDVDNLVKLDLNGAARYSDYSTSGGIWTWKVGGTARLFDDLLLRGTLSRDIRSPSIGELFNVRSINVGPVTDRDTAGRVGVPGFNPNPSPTIFGGGNLELEPETAKTLTFGGSFSPSFIRGLNLSVDYYDVNISGAIASLSATNLTLACAGGSTAACARVIRDPVTQTIVTVFTNLQNLASFEQSGIDIEASYLMQLSRLSDNLAGSFRVRALATHVIKSIFDTGFSRTDNAGNATVLPKWRGILSFTYQDDSVGLDARLRYVGSGAVDKLNLNLINNRIEARTYVDLGAQFKVLDRFTFFGNVNNLFDIEPPISPVGSAQFDVVGTYFTVGARVKF